MFNMQICAPKEYSMCKDGGTRFFVVDIENPYYLHDK